MAQLNPNQTPVKRSAFKRGLLAAALSVGVMFTGTQAVHAASPNKAPPSIKAGAPQVYVVKKGDTLWDIAGKFLKSPWRWKEIWASNRHVKNPHWIYPGDRLLMCTLNGKPLIGKDEGDGCEGIIRRHTGGKTTPRYESTGDGVPVIPLSFINKWLQHFVIISPDSLKDVPYIIAANDGRVLAGKGQIVYARGNGLHVGQRYAIYRPEKPYTLTIPAEGKFQKDKTLNLGVELQQMATAVVTAIDASGTATLEIVESFGGEVRFEYYVLPESPSTLPSAFFPVLKNDVIDGGRVARVHGGISSTGQHGVVTIDRGFNHKTTAGQVFEVRQKGNTVLDPKTKQPIELPAQRIGHVMIFKSFENFSYAYVLDSNLPITVGSSIHHVESFD